MNTRRRGAGWIRAASVALVFVLAIPGTASAASAATACASSNVIALKTLRIEASTDKEVYRSAEMGEIHVLVTRPAEEDPAGQGIEIQHPVRLPAEDVTVGVWLTAAKDYEVGAGITGPDGMAHVMIRMPSLIPKGLSKATVYVFAFKEVVFTPCFQVEEQGLWEQGDFVRIKRSRH